MDDQLLLEDGLPLVVGVTLVVDNVLNHSWRQRVGDHLFFVPKGAQSYLQAAEFDYENFLATER